MVFVVIHTTLRHSSIVQLRCSLAHLRLFLVDKCLPSLYTTILGYRSRYCSRTYVFEIQMDLDLIVCCKRIASCNIFDVSYIVFIQVHMFSTTYLSIDITNLFIFMIKTLNWSMISSNNFSNLTITRIIFFHSNNDTFFFAIKMCISLTDRVHIWSVKK